MPRLDRIYTRGGDRGQTSLSDGTRIAKSDLRVECYGTVNEASATLGVARLYAAEAPGTDEILSRIQNDLFDLGADLSTPETTKRSSGALRIAAGQVTRLEHEIDTMNAELQPLANFILPAGKPLGAHLHWALTVVRRAERLAVALAARETINPQAVKYLNRLSDHLFVLARFVSDKGAGDVLWVPGANR